MADHSLIEWTDATWNPITGCSIVSPGCTICYAMKLAGSRLKHHPSRQGLTRDSKAGPVWTGEVRLNEEWLAQPLGWNKPRRIFVCAHGDLFAENVPDGWIMLILNVMAQCPQHTFQVLTKRASRMRDFFQRWANVEGEDFSDFKDARGPAEVRAMHPSPRGQLFADMLESMGAPPPGAAYPSFDWMGGMLNWPDVLPNVWVGVSAEDQQRADERIPELLVTPAAVRFLSAEPLLGPIRLRGTSEDRKRCWDWLSGETGVMYEDGPDFDHGACLDWVIVGGESGQGARPMHPDWVRSLSDQCATAGTAFFFKQWGEWAPICFMSENQIDACYDPAPARYPEALRRCKVDQCVIHTDGERFELDAWSRQVRHGSRRMFEADFNGMTMYSIGKKRAGRLLYGVEHNAMPEVPKWPC